MIELENGETREFEGEKKDIETLVVLIESAVKSPKSLVGSKLAQSPLNANPPYEPVIAISPKASIHSPKMGIKVAIALYDYIPAEEGELEVHENDMLTVLDTSDADWWLVRHINKKGEGLVPMTYVEVALC